MYLNRAFFSEVLTRIMCAKIHEYAFKAKGILCCEYIIHKSLLYAFTYEPTIFQCGFPHLNNSRQAIIGHSYLSDGIYEKNTEIHCGWYTFISFDSEDFFFFLVSNSERTAENLFIERRKIQVLSEGNFSEAMLRLLGNSQNSNEKVID